MSTRIRIERMVLDGIELSRRERDALGPAISRELQRLVVAPAGRRDGPWHTDPSPTVDRIAREVAAAVRLATAAARPATRPAAAGIAGPAGAPAMQRGNR